MKLVFASDSFKGSLSAVEIVSLLGEAARSHFPGAEIVLVPVADGGEGTVDALVVGGGGERHAFEVTGPLGGRVNAVWATIDGGSTAVIEMAQASGLPLAPAASRNPEKTTSYGTGELIARALDAGVAKILIGIGGSATNDGGMGMLRALGARFLDRDGGELRGAGEDLARVDSADLTNLHPALTSVEMQVICDVTNPLLGPQGATAVYGPQKGAAGPMLQRLEQGMANYAAVLERALGRDISRFPGAGAAGGMGAALGGVLGAAMKPGIDAVLDILHFDRLLNGCHLVITGEGRLDGQSVQFGKVPVGVARRCAARDIPVIAIVGGIGEGASGFYSIGEASAVSIVPAPMPLERAMENAREYLREAADRTFRILKIGMRMVKR